MCERGWFEKTRFPSILGFILNLMQLLIDIISELCIMNFEARIRSTEDLAIGNMGIGKD